jgi:probable HAF family extracellular repeat protein
VRNADGTFTTFRPKGTSTETQPWAINAAGAIVGTYETSDVVTHAFLRQADGTILNIDHPQSERDTVPMAIRDDGVIVGNFDGMDGNTHGFIRTP